MRIHLTMKDKKLNKEPSIKKWLRQCEIRVQQVDSLILARAYKRFRRMIADKRWNGKIENNGQ